MISGCRDEQTSGETEDDYGRHGGMMTTVSTVWYIFIDRMTEPVPIGVNGVCR